ncbi:phosphate ABC transporter permease [Pseudomonas oryzihabitans]|uniref:phosphate ABC transporter permease subunit PstC n=1 Tax=Pseudomonas rhizoryzae TaxID=2571129 RepID=UPI0007372571|nr:phosphate ABC transporter permease subunit PstC [Pseudomonas rhizoryzae]APQ11820.1 phosphate ABC transporter permease subunit PstC [Pseudomonas psychrotolerans]KTS75245.1 phosphate ABC transporter permease [Pseudomonas psychrotolerans]KTT04187.1 phosphate ABC transporter permease [Pseudomonas psychrotolerans]KTT08949.1 phosphate ABC transporter permease [Pseudomonas psychrotolerans]KTT21156.1 phosphate ABC transporter permease [Pseudomonas psychrotolerans]
MTDQTLPLSAAQEERIRRDTRADTWFRRLLFSAALLVLLVLVGAALSTLWGGRQAFMTFGLSFLTSTEWDVGAEKFGALVPIYGTLMTSLIALVLAVPTSFGIALFLSEIAPLWLRGPVATAVELLAGIPSIIYGMWGLFVFGPFMAAHISPFINDYLGAIPIIGALFQGPPLGIGMLTAGIILAIMILPFITSVMYEVFRSVPPQLKESAYALGSTTWEVCWDIVLPYTRSAVVGGAFLGLGRALGETMAVTFVLGNAHQFSVSLMMPSSSIASVIANEFNEAYTDLHRSALLALGFLLFVVTFIVLLAARLMLTQLSRKAGN